MKKITLALGILCASVTSIGQTHQHVHHDLADPIQCGVTEQTNRIFSENPEFGVMDSITRQQMQEEYEAFLADWSPDDRATYVVPVVVHVVHLGGAENITDEQILSAIDNMNADFSATNSDLSATIPEFEDVIGNCDIEFRLATLDPNGDCHPGITRTVSETTYDTGMSGGGHPIVEAVRDVHGNWPQNKYMNVFVCIDPSGAAGYTYNPGGWYPAGGMYGSIFMRHDYMGTIGTSSAGRRHTLAHEAGHWLNLSHPWGGSNTPGLDSNCGSDDGVSDTPNTVGWNNCSDVYGETCGSLDNVQNIMDYSYCSTMFTAGQAARVQSSLLGGTAQRFKLSTPANLVATGTDGPGALCVAEFSSNINSVCQGASISFSDLSYHTVTSRTWTFEGGSPATSTAENPEVTYNTPGIYSVTLEVSNGGFTETTTEEAFIVVFANEGASIPYIEGFETLPSVPDNDRFLVENETGDSWELSTTVSFEGSNCAVLNNYGVTDGSTDALVSGTIDLSGVDPDDDIIFNFKYAYKRKASANDEYLRFYISKDCGETWALRKNVHGDDLGPQVTSGPYAPSSDVEWREISITNIFPDYYVGNFRFKIEFENDNGNNIYIDNINISSASMVSIDENTFATGISVYPNPIASETFVAINAVAGENYNIVLYNALGEQITTVYDGELAEGENTLSFATESLAKGVYILRVASQGRVETIKVIKE